MAYSPTTWQTGDTITAAKMNKIENGIASAGGMMIFTMAGGTLNKTWQEIYDATASNMLCVAFENEDGYNVAVVGACYSVDAEYHVDMIGGMPYMASSANGYPVIVD